MDIHSLISILERCPTIKISEGGNTSKARFKVETLLSSKKKQVNISLGKGEALDRFNSNIIEFKKIKDIGL